MGEDDVDNKWAKNKEDYQTVTNCHALKLQEADGKMRMMDVTDSEQP